MSVRQMLKQLVLSGFEVKILGTTTFDHANGLTNIENSTALFEQRRGKYITALDSPLEHLLYVTKDICRENMLAKEVDVWSEKYCQLLDSYQPDLLWFYGGRKKGVKYHIDLTLS